MKIFKTVKTGGILSRFASSASGSVAMTMAISAIPLFLAAGIALDFVRGLQAESKLQAAVDSAALAAAHEEDLSDSELDSYVRKYLTANGTQKILKELTEVKVTRISSTQLQVSAKGRISTTLMKIAGYKTMDVGAVSVINSDFGNLEVALVLDNTWSMSANGKMASLKSAAHTLINELYDNKGDGVDLKAGLVPFAQYVNIGMGNRNALWADVPADWDETRHYNGYWYRPVIRTYNCHNEQRTGSRDGVSYTYTARVCDHEYGERQWHEGGTWVQRHRWYGCVGSRNAPLNARDEAPGTRIPGLLDVHCARPFTRLTDSRAAISAEIDRMTATGNQTYIPAGLMWGWRLLSSVVPISDGVDKTTMKAKNYTKAIVLMTDGKNTRSKSSGAKHAKRDNGRDANALTARICRNIKAETADEDTRIKIYTVTFDVTDPGIKDLMRNCATNDSYYFDADDGAALAKAFKDIATSLTTLYISK
ncbi:MAG TPA: pilus assembly protein [Rhizobiales bacterium]|nr:pilus assembly protein [Hyphomicrobiales bacterium]